MIRQGFFFLLAVSAYAAPASSAAISPQQYINDVKYLSSDQMKGRGTGTPELEKAAKFIAGEFHKAGLQPIDGKSYEQAFTVSINAHLGSHNQLSYSLDGHRQSLRVSEEFLPFNFSGTGKISGSVVFTGYGITAREYNYEDYAHLDVKNKIVLVLRHEPQEVDAQSAFDGRSYAGRAQL